MSKQKIRQISKVSEQTAPEQTAPEQTAPEQTAPEQTAPEQTAEPNWAPGLMKDGKRVTLVSTTIPGLWCRMMLSVAKTHGLPLDPNGVRMVPGVVASGLRSAPGNHKSKAEREAERKAEREAEQARLAAMTPAERAEHLALVRKKRLEAKEQKRSAKKAELVKRIERIREQDPTKDLSEILAEVLG